MDYRTKHLNTKRMKELMQLLRLRKVDYSDCVEKGELIMRIIETDSSNHDQPNINENPMKEKAKKGKRKKKEPKVKKKTKKSFAKDYLHMGIKKKNEGKTQEAVVYYKKGLECDIESPVLWYNLGVCFAEQGKNEEAKDAYLQAIKFEPNFAYAQNNLGAYYKELCNFEQANYHYQAAVDADPKFALAWSNLAVTLHCLGLAGEARRACERAVALNPKSAEAQNNMGTMFLNEGYIQQAVRCFTKCIEIDPEMAAEKFAAFGNRFLAMNSLPPPEDSYTKTKGEDTYSNMLFEAHELWGIDWDTQYEEIRYKSWSQYDFTPDRIIKVGYVSADLREHPVSYFIEGPLRFMDDTKIEHFCYATNIDPVNTRRTTELQSLLPEENWRAVGKMPFLELCELIRRDEIDILVDLGGHSCGSRLDVMVMRPCPVQVTWIGYANTTGLSTIDYRITDYIADPINTKQKYTEKLIRMPEPCAFLHYSGSLSCPEPTESPALKKGYLTFGSFNTLSKITPRVFELWCKVLKSIPQSRFFFKTKQFNSEMTRREWLIKFRKKGIHTKRIILKQYAKSRSQHLGYYNNDVDIQLDTFPYSGTTTSCESIWMGVPVITLKKSTFPIHAHNVGVSLFSRIPSLKPFIAKNKKDYIDIALYWSQNVPKLNKIRKNLRNDIKKSPLSDGPLFCKKLEEVYRKMWVKRCEEENEKGDDDSSDMD